MLTSFLRIAAVTAVFALCTLLPLTPEELALDRTRGHYAVHDAPHPHWKYFWFD